MRAVTWAAGGVHRLDCRAVIAGVEYAASGVRVSSESVGGNPFGPDSTMSTGGRVSIESMQPVRRQLGPGRWAADPAQWPPPKGASIHVIGTDSEGEEWTLVDGLLDSVPGGVSNASADVTFVDQVYRLSGRVTSVPHARTMPGYVDGQPFRPAGLTLEWLIDHLGYQVDYGAMVRVNTASRAKTLVRLSHFGSMLPSVGSMLNAGRKSDLTAIPVSSYDAAGRLNMRDAYSDISAASGTARKDVLAVMELTAQAGTDYGRVLLYDDTSQTGIEVTHFAEGDAVIVKRVLGGVKTTVLTLPRGGATRVLVQTSTDGQVRARLNFTSEWSEWVAGVDQVISKVSVNSTGRIGSVLVTDASAAVYEPRTRIRSGYGYATNLAAHPQLDSAFIDFLTQCTRATGADCWITETGQLEWVARKFLDSDVTNQPAGVVLSTLDTVDDVRWVDDLMSARSSITLKYKEPAITLRNRELVRLNRDTSVLSLDPGDIEEIWLEPASQDDSWIMPDQSITVRSSVSEPPDWQVPGSQFMAVLVPDDSNAAEIAATTAQVTFTYSWVTATTCKVVIQAKSWPSTYRCEVRFPKTWRKSSEPMPRIAGRGRVEWRDSSETAPTSSLGPAAEVDLSYWGHGDGVVDGLMSLFRDYAQSPLPTLSDVTVGYDPRVQLGDKVLVTDPVRTGVSLTIVVLSLDAEPLRDTMTLGGRVTGVAIGALQSVLSITVDDIINAWKAA